MAPTSPWLDRLMAVRSRRDFLGLATLGLAAVALPVRRSKLLPADSGSPCEVGCLYYYGKTAYYVDLAACGQSWKSSASYAFLLRWCPCRGRRPWSTRYAAGITSPVETRPSSVPRPTPTTARRRGAPASTPGPRARTARALHARQTAARARSCKSGSSAVFTTATTQITAAVEPPTARQRR